jgi:3-oxoacyl-[acyl-carrier protein] reductase
MDQVAVITGSGSGIGRVTALEFSREGYIVVVNDIVKEAGEAVLGELERGGGKGLFIQADVSDATQVKAMFEEIKRECSTVDVLVNNAGIPGPFSLIVDMSDETWHKTIGVHLTGTFYCMREAARMMLKNGFGRIVNMASIAGLSGTVGSSEYGAAKAAIINLTKTGAKELGPYNITVNAIAPGMVGTETNLKLKEKGSPFIDIALDGTPTGRMTTPEEIASLILWLCSSGAANVNGHVIRADGGAEIHMSMDGFMLSFLSKKSQIVSKK